MVTLHDAEERDNPWPSLPRLSQHLLPLVSTLLTLGVDAICFLRLCLRSRTSLVAENLFCAKSCRCTRNILSNRSVPRTRPVSPLSGCPLVRLAPSPNRGTTEDLFPLASPRIAAVLAACRPSLDRQAIPPELQALIRRMARDNGGATGVSKRHGQRIVAQARPAGLAAHRAQVYTQASAPCSRPTRDVPALAYVRSPSRVGLIARGVAPISPEVCRPWLQQMRCAASAVPKTNRRERVTGPHSVMPRSFPRLSVTALDWQRGRQSSWM